MHIAGSQYKTNNCWLQPRNQLQKLVITDSPYPPKAGNNCWPQPRNQLQELVITDSPYPPKAGWTNINIEDTHCRFPILNK